MLEAKHGRAVCAGVALMLLALAMVTTGAGCSKRKPSACVDPAGASCQVCRDASKAKFCDAKYVAPVASGKITVNGQKGCCGFDDPTLRAQCEGVLRCVRTAGCAVGNDPTPCLCGDLDPMTCARSSKHAGRCVAAYKAALVPGGPDNVIAVLGDPKHPIGVANNTFTCDADGKCPCSQK